MSTTASSEQENTVNLSVENMLGQRLSMRVRKSMTVRQLKSEIEKKMKLKASNQSLVRRGVNGYMKLDDGKTLAQYDLVDGDQILIVPAMNTAPPGFALKGPTKAAKVFMDVNGSTAVASTIDSFLAQRNLVRDPKSIYLLVQLPGQPDNSYTIVEYRPDEKPFQDMNSSEQTSSSSVEAPEKVLVVSEVDRKQNVKTQTAMSKLRAHLDKQKRGKKQNVLVEPICTRCRSAPCRCDRNEPNVPKVPNVPNAPQPFSEPRRSSCNIS